MTKESAGRYVTRKEIDERLARMVGDEAKGSYLDRVLKGKEGRVGKDTGQYAYNKLGEIRAESVMDQNYDALERIGVKMPERHHKRGLGSKLTLILIVAGIIGGIFILSSNVTGNTIVDLPVKPTYFLGAGLLIAGLVAGFFWMKMR